VRVIKIGQHLLVITELTVASSMVYGMCAIMQKWKQKNSTCFRLRVDYKICNSLNRTKTF